MRLADSSAQEFRYRTIVKLHNQGKTQQEISEIVACSQAWVSKILKRHKNLPGQGFLKAGKAKGAEPKLNEEEFSQLPALLQQGALAHGFATDNWTRERIAKLILNKFSVSYHPAHISRLMRKLGFSLQKPKSKSYRRDEAAIEKWKGESLPRLKKSET